MSKLRAGGTVAAATPTTATRLALVQDGARKPSKNTESSATRFMTESTSNPPLTAGPAPRCRQMACTVRAMTSREERALERFLARVRRHFEAQDAAKLATTSLPHSSPAGGSAPPAPAGFNPDSPVCAPISSTGRGAGTRKAASAPACEWGGAAC